MNFEAMPHIDVTPHDWNIIQNLLQKHIPAIEVWAFGSRAMWKAKKFSDLDLALIGREPLPIEKLLTLQEDFAESDLPYKVDWVDWEVTSPEFRKIIESQKVVIQGQS